MIARSTETNLNPRGYPCFLERDPSGRWAGFCLELPVFVWGKESQEKALASLAKGLALALSQWEGPVPSPGRSLTAEETEEAAKGLSLVYVEPSRINPLSLKLRRALEESGLSLREVARRMGTTPSAVARLLDPFYFGHSMSTLYRLAEALGMRLSVSLEPRQVSPGDAPHSP